MIDYDKLKQAHEKLNDVIKIVSEEYITRDLEDFSDELERKIKQQPKYKEGQYVWVLGANNLPVDVCIQEVDLSSSDEKYLIEDAWFREEELYPSREALIEAKIEYWLGMLEMPEQIRYFANQAKPMSCAQNEEKSTCSDDVSMAPTASCCSVHAGGHEECERVFATYERPPLDKNKLKMIDVNKPLDTTPNTRCHKCKAEFYVHPMAGMNAPYITDCELHNPECRHESDGNSYCNGISLSKDYSRNDLKCKKCGEFYR